jgi:hypothetical protein
MKRFNAAALTLESSGESIDGVDAGANSAAEDIINTLAHTSAPAAGLDGDSRQLCRCCGAVACACKVRKGDGECWFTCIYMSVSMNVGVSMNISVSMSMSVRAQVHQQLLLMVTVGSCVDVVGLPLG